MSDENTTAGEAIENNNVVIDLPKTNGEDKNADSTAITVGDGSEAAPTEDTSIKITDKIEDLDHYINNIPESIKDTKYFDDLKQIINKEGIAIKSMKPILEHYSNHVKESYELLQKNYQQRVTDTENFLSKEWNGDPKNKDKDISYMNNGLATVSKVLNMPVEQVYQELQHFNMLTPQGNPVSPIIAVLLREYGKNNAGPSEVSAKAASQEDESELTFREQMAAFRSQR